MKKVDVTVHAPNAAWSFTVTYDRYSKFMHELKNDRFAILTKTDFSGNVTEYTFNPEMVVLVAATPTNSSF